MKILNLILIWTGSILLMSAVTGCAGQRPSDLGVTHGQFKPCPDSPNCVSSFASTEEHGFPVYLVSSDANFEFKKVVDEVANLPRTKIVTLNDQYLHAEQASKLMGYVDDIQVYWDQSTSQLYFYSASRLGYSDLGVNRARLENLVSRLKDAGLLGQVLPVSAD